MAYCALINWPNNLFIFSLLNRYYYSMHHTYKSIFRDVAYVLLLIEFIGASLEIFFMDFKSTKIKNLWPKYIFSFGESN